jgi:hypothetical protein
LSGFDETLRQKTSAPAAGKRMLPEFSGPMRRSGFQASRSSNTIEGFVDSGRQHYGRLEKTKNQRTIASIVRQRVLEARVGIGLSHRIRCQYNRTIPCIYKDNSLQLATIFTCFSAWLLTLSLTVILTPKAGFLGCDSQGAEHAFK